MERIKWYFKQLLPLTYVSQYTEQQTHPGQPTKMLCIWRMWLGRCFHVRYYELATKTDGQTG